MADQLENRADKPLVLSRREQRLLHRRIHSERMDVRLIAVKELLAHGEQGLVFFQESVNRYARNRSIVRWLMGGFGVAVIWFSLYRPPFDTIGIVYSVGMALMLLLSINERPDVIYTLLQLIHEQPDLKLVPLLVRHGVLAGYSSGDVVEQALALLLPKMQLKDATLLGTEEREILNKALLHASDRRRGFKLAILKAYEQIGDASSLEAVEELLTKRLDDKLRDATETCLLYLKHNIGRVSEVQTLLRASALPDKPEELLRPARERREEEALLRPALTPPSDDRSV